MAGLAVSFSELHETWIFPQRSVLGDTLYPLNLDSGLFMFLSNDTHDTMIPGSNEKDNGGRQDD